VKQVLRAAALATLLALVGVPALAQYSSRPTAPEEAGQVFRADPAELRTVHRASGVTFPDALAGFVRQRLNIYGPDDVGARYGAPAGDPAAPWVDLYVYRSPGSIDDEAANIEAQMGAAFGGLSRRRAVPSPAAVVEARGAIFYAKLGDEPVETAYLIVRSNGWTLKARATERGGFNDEGWARVRALIDAFPWRAMPAPEPAGAASGEGTT